VISSVILCTIEVSTRGRRGHLIWVIAQMLAEELSGPCVRTKVAGLWTLS
jgi:hypothetical protein